VRFGQLTLGVAPTASELSAIQQCVDTLSDEEAATALLGSLKSPTMHILDVIMASVVANL